MQKCQRCEKELSKQQVWNHKKYCSRQCFADSYYGEKIEWNGVQIRPGKALEVLKLCYGGMPPSQACQIVGAHYSIIGKLKTIPEAAEYLSKCACPICGKDVPPPANRKYCSDKCKRRAKYERSRTVKGIKRRFIDYENRKKALELYQCGFEYALIAQKIDVPQQKVKKWLYRSDVVKNFRPLRRQLENAKTAEEWSEILRNSKIPAQGRLDAVVLVCARLHGSGAPGRYISIAAEQIWREDFYDGVCVAFCNILKNAITTIEWRGDNFHLTRTFKTSGTFVWPNENLGRSIEITRVEFDRLISLKKQRKNAENTCIYTNFMIQSEYEK